MTQQLTSPNVREFRDSSVAKVRDQFRTAAIIRPIGHGHYLAFARAEDAIGHPSTARTA